MFDIGFGEFVVVILVALVVLGPEKMADSAERLGKIIASLRRNWHYLSNTSVVELDNKKNNE